jgi:hypothetical protein
MMSTERLCCSCTTHGPALLARLSRDASSSPEGMVADQLNEVYDEVLGRWLRLPRDLPHDLVGMGSALL